MLLTHYCTVLQVTTTYEYDSGILSFSYSLPKLQLLTEIIRPIANRWKKKIYIFLFYYKLFTWPF